MPVSPGAPADTQGHSDPENLSVANQLQLELRRDVLMPDVRAQAQEEGRDPEEVDPIKDDEDALRLTSLGGSSNLK